MPDPLGLVHAVMGEVFPDEPWHRFALAGQRLGSGTGGTAYPSGSGARVQSRGGGFRRMRAENYLKAAAGRPEAMLKIITKGGCKSAGELRTQIAYVAREGAVAIHGAAMFGMDERLSASVIEDTIATWAAGWTGRSQYGETLHMIVSYPIGTDPNAVWNAGRAFAETAFGSGDYGDAWDYVTALHTDTAHPHVHVIVNRRGLDTGRLLSTYKGAALNLDELRQIQVDTAAIEGIALTATPRLARGITELAPTNADYRAAKARGVEPRPRPQTAEAMAFADAALARHAAVFDRLADVFETAERDPLAALLRECGDLLRRGEDIMTAPDIPTDADLTTLTEARTLLLAQLDQATERIRTEADPVARVDAERRIGPLKARAFAYAPDRADLAVHATAVPAGMDLYRSTALDTARVDTPRLDGGGKDQRPALTAARQAMVRAASAAGLDGTAFLARYDHGGPHDAGTAAVWATEDMVAVLKARGVTPDRADPADIRAASSVVDRLHDRTVRAFDQAVRADQAAHGDLSRAHNSDRAAERSEAPALAPTPSQDERLHILHREARAAIDNSRNRAATPAETAAQRAFITALEDRLSRNERTALNQADPTALNRTLPQASRVDRAVMALTYAEAKADLSDEITKHQTAQAVLKARTALGRAKHRNQSRDDQHEL